MLRPLGSPSSPPPNWPPLQWHFGPALTMLWQRLWPAPCLVVCLGPQCVVHRSSGTLCLATEHDADGPLGQDRRNIYSWRGFLLFACINSHVLDWLRIGILSHASMPKRVMVQGGHRCIPSSWLDDAQGSHDGPGRPTLSRWISTLLEHKPADSKSDEDYLEEWVDCALSLRLWVVSWTHGLHADRPLGPLQFRFSALSFLPLLAPPTQFQPMINGATQMTRPNTSAITFPPSSYPPILTMLHAPAGSNGRSVSSSPMDAFDDAKFKAATSSTLFFSNASPSFSTHTTNLAPKDSTQLVAPS